MGRDRLAMLVALVTLVSLGSAFYLSQGRESLMPGPLTSGHGAIENCNACHTKSGSNKLSWIHGLVAADPLADSKACLTCHKMPATAFNAHGASSEALGQSTERLRKIAVGSIAPQSARAQSIAFPMEDVIAGGLFCATCHQEHQGVGFNLNKISNEQCRSCHVAKFDSFDGHHPNFENYPFERRTRIIYDHASHFGKHYPELAKKDPAKRIPATCTACHNSGGDRRVMAVAPFDQTCTTCHLDQIIGKERVSGPKGIAFLNLPGLDLETLRKRNAPIGEWPDAADAGLTPFMKIMLGRNEKGRVLAKAVDGLNLQDLAKADDNQIKVVTDLVWEIKGLFHTLIKEKASDVLGDLRIGGGAKLSATLVADLTASLPRDIVASAQQEWLPNLAAEMANGPISLPEEQSDSAADQPTPAPTPQEPESQQAVQADVAEVVPDTVAQPEVAREIPCIEQKPRAEKEVAEAKPEDGEEALSTEEQALAAIKGRLPLPNGTPRAIKARTKTAEEGTPAKPDSSEEIVCADELPRAAEEAQSEDAAGEANKVVAEADGGNETPPTGEQPPGNATDQFDDLLYPTEEELRAAKANIKDTAKSGQGEAADANAPVDAPAELGTAVPVPVPQPIAVSAVSIESDVDPESWAEYGGWYRQDYAIYYRPTGHKDKFIYSWLFLTGPEAPKGAATPAAAVFDFLTNKEAQGSCTKCHSVDNIRGKGRVVNFTPASVESKRGRFTNFIHEPHMGIMDNRGCLACHSLEKSRPYLKSYAQGNPHKFVPGFSAVKKDLCRTCHTSGKARQDCLLCHKYHVNGAATPTMNTKIPIQ